MTEQEIIERYERVLVRMQEMHEAASRSAWDELTAVEQRCRGVVQELMAQEHAVALSPNRARRKAEIIRQVLALDAAIRDMTEPWLQHLQSFLGSRQRQRRLSATYGPADSL